MNKPWLDRYPVGVPHELPAHEYHSLVDLLDKSFSSFADRPAFHLQGSTMRFSDLERQSRTPKTIMQTNVQ